MSSLVRYWVVQRPSNRQPGTMKPVSHFKSNVEANNFLNSEFFKKTHGEGSVEVVSFDIYETAVEAEADSLQRLRESGLAKLRTLSTKEAIALGVDEILKTAKGSNSPLVEESGILELGEDLVPPSG